MQLQTKVKDIPKHFYYKQSPPSQTSRLPAGAREREKRERSQLAAQCLLQKVASTFSCRGYSLLHSYAQPQIRPNPHCIHGQTAEKAEERSLVAGSNPLSLSLSLSLSLIWSSLCSLQHALYNTYTCLHAYRLCICTVSLPLSVREVGGGDGCNGHGQRPGVRVDVHHEVPEPP